MVLDEAHSYRGVLVRTSLTCYAVCAVSARLYRTVPVFYGAPATSSNLVEPFQAHWRAAAGGYRHYRVHLRAR